MRNVLNGITKISKSEFWKKLEERKFESANLVKQIEKFLFDKREYIIKVPESGESVILLFSGGLDSVIVWELLMKIYGLKVYPLFIEGKGKFELGQRAAIRFFTNYFQEKYPELFVEPERYVLSLMPKKVMGFFEQPKKFSPEYVLNNYENNFQLRFATHPYAYYGAMYAHFLEAKEGLRIRNIVSGINVIDEVLLADQSFTAQRQMMVSLCLATNDYSWSYFALPIEKELGLWLGTKELVKIGKKLNLPLEKTWSCGRGWLMHCGNCNSCELRKESFLRANFKDTTLYVFEKRKTLKKVVKKLNFLDNFWKD